ncbi:hypothetical protein CFELI_05170 [Corynebacterium felinum]|uniref:Transposase n=1 Tax=Corynebacterium felinum TaxID=131318 RepID=A0ABU2BD46_9CORY|nr:hypothetical protein [Corynebacterium felinum]WJY94662.1 hypothetical protein CFELI_05170 [Corynebacterium felinum]
MDGDFLVRELTKVGKSGDDHYIVERFQEWNIRRVFV